MRVSNTNVTDLPLQNLVTEARNIVSSEMDLNKEKENLSLILDQLDFILGKYDEIYTRFTEVFIAMGDFDFSKRLPFYDDKDNFINFIVSGVNMINEELEANALKKGIFHRLLHSLALKDTLLVITNSDGFISFANSGSTSIDNFNDSSLFDQGINSLFTNYNLIENKLKEEGTLRNIDCFFKWKGVEYPANVDVTLSSTYGKIDSLIYLIKLK